MVWLGDVFDHPRPTYRSFRVAQRALLRIREHGVALVVISGNHDTPRLPGTGSPYSALADMFPEVHFAHRLAYERFELPGLVVHGVPQMLTVDATLEALDEADRARSVDSPTCCSPTPGSPRSSPATPTSTRSRSTPAACGPTSCCSATTTSTPGRPRAPGTPGPPTPSPSPTTPTRPRASSCSTPTRASAGTCRSPASGRWSRSRRSHALGLSPAEVEAQVLERAAAVPDGAVARLYLDGVDPEAYRLLDLEAVREAGAAALHLKLEPTFAGVDMHVELPDLESMGARWHRYLEDQDLTGFDREPHQGPGRRLPRPGRVEESG